MIFNYIKLNIIMSFKSYSKHKFNEFYNQGKNNSPNKEKKTFRLRENISKLDIPSIIEKIYYLEKNYKKNRLISKLKNVNRKFSKTKINRQLKILEGQKILFKDEVYDTLKKSILGTLGKKLENYNKNPTYENLNWYIDINVPDEILVPDTNINKFENLKELLCEYYDNFETFKETKQFKSMKDIGKFFYHMIKKYLRDEMNLYYEKYIQEI